VIRDHERKVQERTKDLDRKVQELTETKTAVLNMMEDMEETNKNLVKTQQQLKETLKELKESDIKKDEFISIAAHELKTPLTSIHGFSQLLLSPGIAADEEKRGKFLRIMEKESMRLAKLVNDILDLSRIDLGTIKVNNEEIDTSQLMDDVEREMDIPMKERGLRSEYDIEKGLPRMVTDQEKLREILINIISNAIKYTPKGKISVKVQTEDGNLQVMVKDTGIGISEEQQKKLFHRFYQIDSSYTRKAGGAGLGLALSKEFVELMGGRIWIISQEGKGSEFHFTLPIKPPLARPAIKPV